MSLPQDRTRSRIISQSGNWRAAASVSRAEAAPPPTSVVCVTASGGPSSRSAPSQVAFASVPDTTVTATPEHAPGPNPSGFRVRYSNGASHLVSAAPLSLLVLGLVVLIGAVRISLSLGHPFLPFSDVAFIELDVRQATHLAAHLGPYSQYGWHHPGPARFYLFAPLYWLAGGSSRALFLDAWLLNGAAALGCVLIVRRQAGETAARIAAVAMGVYLGATGFSELINPWQPCPPSAPCALAPGLRRRRGNG